MAGCGCGSSSRQRRLARTMSAGPPNGQGSYPLGSFPGCTDIYSGPLDGESTIVVGRLTAGERLFPRIRFAEASDYAVEVRSGIENLPNSGLCRQAVEDAWAPA